MPLFCRQTIYDRLNKKLLHVKARDLIDLDVIGQIFCDNDYGFEKFQRRGDISKYYHALVSDNSVPLIVDCGANSGMATKFFAETYPNAHIVAIEPDRKNFELAQQNNLGGNVTFILAGVGHSEDRGDIVDPKLGHWAYRIDTNANGSTEIVSINKILSERCGEFAKPFIVKIDIEGFESNLFLKNTEWIEKFPVLIIELHDWMLPKTANSNNFLKKIAQLDRDFIYVGENVFSISNTIL
jgi:FkbM family methyltransferase